MPDVLAVISWWIIIEILGLVAWPLAFRLFRWLPDRGYMLAKPLGLLLVSYIFWLAVSFHLLPNTSLGILAAFIFIVAVNFGIYRRGRDASSGLMSWLRDHYRLIIAYELLFALAFIGWAIFRAYSPDISSAEKPMAMAFFNAVTHSETFPPYDPWLAGYTISYYYFGYVMTSLFQRLSGVNIGVAFSLGNALWFALGVGGAFGLVANLVLLTRRSARRAAICFGALGAILLMITGNLEAPLDVAYTRGWGTSEFWNWLDIQGLNQPYIPVENQAVPSWFPRAERDWWWSAARVIHDYQPTSLSPRLSAVMGVPPDQDAASQEVIDEYPLFGFVLGDLHPHLLNLPFVLLALGLALNVYCAGASGEASSLLWRGQRVPLAWCYPLIVGSAGFLNTWDLPIYLLLTVAAFALAQWRTRRLNGAGRLVDVGLMGIGSVAFYLPYYLNQNLTGQVTGLVPNLFNGTRSPQFFIMFGPFLIFGMILGATLVVERVRSKQARLRDLALQSLVVGIGLILVAIGATVLLGVVALRPGTAPRVWLDNVMTEMATRGITLRDHLLARLSDPWTLLMLALGLAAIFMLWRKRRGPTDSRSISSLSLIDFDLLLFFVGLLLAFGIEFVFVFDYFKARTNTVFKFYYQVWILWSIASAYAIYHVLYSPDRISGRGRRAIVGVVTLTLIALSLIYPALAIPSRTIDTNEPTLDAMLATSHSPLYPGAKKSYAAVRWLNQNVSGTPVVLQGMREEAQYQSSLARISSWTGLPTLLGWLDHEIQWRGSSDMLRQRLADIETIYATTDLATALALLHQYNVQYIYVGGVERKQYPAAGLAKFDRSLPVVFQQDDVTIYQVPATLMP